METSGNGLKCFLTINIPEESLKKFFSEPVSVSWEIISFNVLRFAISGHIIHLYFNYMLEYSAEFSIVFPHSEINWATSLDFNLLIQEHKQKHKVSLAYKQWPYINQRILLFENMSCIAGNNVNKISYSNSTSMRH